MKKVLSIQTAFAMVILFAAQAQAIRPAQDFGSLIEENAAAQKQLTRELQQQLKTNNLGKAQKPNFKEVGEQVLGKEQAENVAVETAETTQTKSTTSIDIEKKNFNRLSQEIKDLK